MWIAVSRGFAIDFHGDEYSYVDYGLRKHISEENPLTLWVSSRTLLKQNRAGVKEKPPAPEVFPLLLIPISRFSFNHVLNVPQHKHYLTIL